MYLPASSRRLSFPKLPDLHAWILVNGKAQKIHDGPTSGSTSSGTVYLDEGTRFDFVYADMSLAAPSKSYVSRFEVDGTIKRNLVTSSRDQFFRSEEDDNSRYGTASGSFKKTASCAVFSSTSSTTGGLKPHTICEVTYFQVTNIRGKACPEWDWVTPEDEPLSTVSFTLKPTAARPPPQSKKRKALAAPAPAPSPHRTPSPELYASETSSPLAFTSAATSPTRSFSLAGPVPRDDAEAEDDEDETAARMEYKIQMLKREQELAALEEQLRLYKRKKGGKSG
ncbi:hypothetical protein JCM10207_007477 [Rhodosporidiobolus poonsookiae]